MQGFSFVGHKISSMCVSSSVIHVCAFPVFRLLRQLRRIAPNSFGAFRKQEIKRALLIAPFFLSLRAAQLVFLDMKVTLGSGFFGYCAGEGKNFGAMDRKIGFALANPFIFR